MRPENPVLVSKRFREIVNRTIQRMEQEWADFQKQCKETPNTDMHNKARWTMENAVKLAQLRRRLNQEAKDKESDLMLETDDFEDKAAWHTVSDRKFRGDGKQKDEDIE